jgi:succinoglycan biosynthesis protein ExoL
MPMSAAAIQPMPAVSEPGEKPRRVIAFFGHDSTEYTLIKRVTSFQAHGSRVIGFMFKRIRNKRPRPVQWENVELGLTVDRNYLRRLPKLARGLMIALQHRHLLRQCQIFYARNIDMLLIAVLSKLLSGSKAPVVYEVLDVQRIFVGSRFVNVAARWAERRLMAQCSTLVVSSPDFMTRYFLPQQGYTGDWRLLENKVSVPPAVASRAEEQPQHLPRPWVIGWFGTLRCVRSLQILCEIADTLGEEASIHLRGLPSHEDLPLSLIEAAAAERRNFRYGGPYASPDDLAAIYADVHFAWCVDYLDAGGNSDWLLPNRIYEGGMMGSLALARKNTAVSRFVESHALGWSFDEPLALTVAAFLRTLDAATYWRARSHVAGLKRSLFVDETDTRDLLDHVDRLAGIASPEPAASSR